MHLNMMVNKVDGGISSLSYSFPLIDEVVHMYTNCLANYICQTIGTSWQSGSKLILVVEGHSGNALVVHNQSCSALPLGAVLVEMLQCMPSSGKFCFSQSQMCLCKIFLLLKDECSAEYTDLKWNMIISLIVGNHRVLIDTISIGLRIIRQSQQSYSLCCDRA